MTPTRQLEKTFPRMMCPKGACVKATGLLKTSSVSKTELTDRIQMKDLALKCLAAFFPGLGIKLFCHCTQCPDTCDTYSQCSRPNTKEVAARTDISLRFSFVAVGIFGRFSSHTRNSCLLSAVHFSLSFVLSFSTRWTKYSKKALTKAQLFPLKNKPTQATCEYV